MGIQFGFAVVPFKLDGDIDELYEDEPNEEDLKEGVVFLDTKGEEGLSTCALGFNNSAVRAMNEITQGILLELCKGQTTQWYILLESRRQHLARLRETLSNFSEEDEDQKELKKRLACLLDNADAYLIEHGTRAAMLIYG